MVAVTGLTVVLTAAKAGTLPTPLAASPILVLSFVQLYTVPATGPLIATGAVADPLQTV